jgi:hypothetical protein
MDFETTPKRNDIWKCPQCENEITLHVRVSEPPVCRNKNAHSTKSRTMYRLIRTESSTNDKKLLND